MFMHFLLYTLACLQPDVTDSGVAPEVEPEPLVRADPTQPDDIDGDGYTFLNGDCDDLDPERYPGRVEDCNGIDDNCNGRPDEGFDDTDTDGIADCMDLEECDGLDNDGDGAADEGMPDTDGDGIVDCQDVEDCDGVDNNGDGTVDEGHDADGDGWNSCDECDDTNPDISPDQPEVDTTSADEDCDGFIDESPWTHGDLVLTELMINPVQTSDPKGEWFEVFNASDRVIHLNGVSVITDLSTERITADEPLPVQPGQRVVLGPNSDTTSNGGVAVAHQTLETSLTNEGGSLALFADVRELDTVTWDATVPEGASYMLDPHHLSADDNDDAQWWCPGTAAWSGSDDLGSPLEDNPLCPSVDHDFDGYTPAQNDCDDAEPDTNPGMAEIWYDGVDRDCDGWSDDDADYDGHDWVDVGGTDCDDTRDDVNPDRDELCNSIDDNCDGETDEDTATDARTWYVDDDLDTYGLATSGVTTCTKPTGTVLIPGDCDDEEPLANPGQTEICNDGFDNDCDGGASGCGLSGEENLSDADASWWGVNRSDYAGNHVSSGDWNGDGAADLLIGAYGAGSRGRAYVVFGPLTAGGRLDSKGVAWEGETSNDYFGWRTSSAGDIDGDGLEDLAVGDYSDDDRASNAGKVSIILGADMPESGSAPSPWSTYTGMSSSDYAGYSLASVGDIDSDGTDDLAVGAMDADGDDSASGVVYLVTQHAEGQESLNSVSIRLTGAGRNDEAGYDVAGPGDVDGDGVNDVLVGAATADGGASNSGIAYLVLGPVAGDMSLSDADTILPGVSSSDEAGTCVASAGDQDGDGLPDLFIGAYRADDGGSSSGTSYVISGLTTGQKSLNLASAKIIGENSSDYSGIAAANLGDTDGDGFDDLMVGAYGADDAGSSSGNAYVLLGPVSGTVRLANADGTWSGNGSSVYAGRALAGPGDVDGDGFGDALVTAYQDNAIDSDAGAVYLLLGGGL